MAEPIYTGTEAELREILGGTIGEERASKWVGTSKLYLTGLLAFLGGIGIVFGVVPDPDPKTSGAIIATIGGLVQIFRVISPMVKLRFSNP